MGDIETASTLALVAGILQIVFSLIFIAMGGFMVLLFLPLMMDPFLMGIMGAFVIAFLFYPVMGVIGLIFAVLWLNWRQFPSEHKTGLIVTGIISLITVGFIPGLLALIAGVIAPSLSKHRGFVPPKTSTAKIIRRCPSCGAETTGDDDQFCWSCGAAF